ncbi:MAG: FIST C-terminal domain-containing protein, partial [Myxococcales bacterium]|nr:FIST C-terminal domain-containing protein [Myxococcales bacterium]
IAVGQAEGSDPRALVDRVVDQCRAGLGGAAPSVGIVTLSGAVDPLAALEALRAALPGVPFVGGSTAGDLSSALGFSEDSLALTLFASDHIRFAVGYGERLNERPEGAVEDAMAMARRALAADGGGDQEALSLVYVDSTAGRNAGTVDVMNELRAPGAAIFGGVLAYPFGGPRRIYEFAGDRVLEGAVVVLLLRGPVRYAWRVSNAWRPIGPRERARVVGNRVERIGERTALDFVRHYLGEHFQPSGEFPLAVFDGASDRFYLRGLWTVEGDALSYVAPIPDGALVQLCEYVRPEVLADTEATVEEVARALPEAEPAGAIVFSCAVRKMMLGTHIAKVSRLLGEHLAVPFAGFYAYGEIAPLAPGGPAFFHNATMITLLLGEEGDRRGRTAPRPRRPARIAEALDEPARVDAATVPDLPPIPADLDADALRRKLQRSEAYRARLENTREQQMVMMRTISAEIDAARRQIAAKNAELSRLNEALAAEKQKSDELLRNILPREVAEELKRTGRVEPVYYERVSVLFTDFQGFTRIAKQMSPAELIRELDYFFSAFDAIVERRGLEKLKTIGDAYMCAGGIPAPNDSHALDAVAAAWEMQAFMREAASRRAASGRPCWRLRIGIHTGPLMAGVIGNKKFAYDIWGDTVNIASRLESTGEPGRINVSATTFAAVEAAFSGEHRGRITAKNAGEIDMYFIVGPRDDDRA